jgi:hypothetical protein
MLGGIVDKNSNNNFVQEMGIALERVQGLINKAYEQLLRNEIHSAKKTLQEASDACDMEDNTPEILFEKGTKVWVILPNRGSVAGVFEGMHCDGIRLICTLLAGPNKFNEQVVTPRSGVKLREE